MLLGVFLIVLGNILHVVQEARGWIRFVLTTISHRLINADVLCVEIILGWRNGPSLLRDNDDDDSICSNNRLKIILFFAFSIVVSDIVYV